MSRIGGLLIAAVVLAGVIQAPSRAQRSPTEANAVPVSYVIPNPLPEGPGLPNDEKLSCRQILEESRGRLRQLDDLDAERSAVVYKKGAKTKALEVAGTVLGGMLPGPLGQGASTAAAAAQLATTRDDAKANYGDIDGRAQWVMNRMDHVNSLYQARCL
jgi:hypothetical protein